MADNCAKIEVVEQVNKYQIEVQDGDQTLLVDETTSQKVIVEIQETCDVVEFEIPVEETKISFDILPPEQNIIELVEIHDETTLDVLELCGPDQDLLERVRLLEEQLANLTFPIRYELSTSRCVPEEGRLFLKRDEVYTSSSPLSYEQDVEVQQITVSLDKVASFNWNLELVDDLTGSVIGSILFPAGQRIQSFSTAIAVGSGTSFGVRWSGPSSSTWSNSLVEIQARQV